MKLILMIALMMTMRLWSGEDLYLTLSRRTALHELTRINHAHLIYEQCGIKPSSWSIMRAFLHGFMRLGKTLLNLRFG